MIALDYTADEIAELKAVCAGLSLLDAIQAADLWWRVVRLPKLRQALAANEEQV